MAQGSSGGLWLSRGNGKYSIDMSHIAELLQGLGQFGLVDRSAGGGRGIVLVLKVLSIARW